MTDKKQNHTDHLIDAYDAMLSRLHEASDAVEHKTLPWLRETLAKAREQAVTLEELSREEADKISSYIERDLKDAAHFLAESDQNFCDWLKFDWQFMQNTMLDMFANMADQTSQTLQDLAQQARENSLYHTGEITAPGTLACVNCGATLHLKKTSEIPPCPKCFATEFRRNA